MLDTEIYGGSNPLLYTLYSERFCKLETKYFKYILDGSFTEKLMHISYRDSNNDVQPTRIY